jgi:hypothetical protein
VSHGEKEVRLQALHNTTKYVCGNYKTTIQIHIYSTYFMRAPQNMDISEVFVESMQF